MKLFTLALFAGSLSASPISITGWGDTFSGSDQIVGAEITFSGGTGDTLSGGYFTNNFSGFVYQSIFGSNRYSPMGAYVDGQYFSPGFATFTLADGDGKIIGYDAQHTPVAIQEISGWIEVTSFACVGDGLDRYCITKFNIVATPEPGTWLLLALGLGLLAVADYRGALPGK